MKIQILMFVSMLLSVYGSQKTFHGDQVLLVYPKTGEQIRVIKQLEDTPGLVDFWSPKYGHQVDQHSSVYIRIPSDKLDKIKDLMNRYGIQYEVKIHDVQKLIDNETQNRSAQSHAADYYNMYHSLKEIYEWTERITSQYPELVALTRLGESYEGRDIPMLTISTNPNNPSILVDCGFHAREWISPAFCQCFTRNLLDGYGSDPIFTRHLDSLTFHVIPVVNVDGYDYSHKIDRLWRKTRANYDTTCTGVDPNRNCNASWSGPGSSGNPCAETYYGPWVESEIEIRALSDFIRGNAKNIMAYITVHSFSQLVIYPYGYTFATAENQQILHKYAEQASQEIEKVFGTRYVYGQTSRVLYRAAGGSDDFAYDMGIPLSYTLELRDTGEHGFVLPADQIEPTCIETTAGMKVFADGVLELLHNQN